MTTGLEGADDDDDTTITTKTPHRLSYRTRSYHQFHSRHDHSTLPPGKQWGGGCHVGRDQCPLGVLRRTVSGTRASHQYKNSEEVKNGLRMVAGVDKESLEEKGGIYGPGFGVTETDRPTLNQSDDPGGSQPPVSTRSPPTGPFSSLSSREGGGPGPGPGPGRPLCLFVSTKPPIRVSVHPGTVTREGLREGVRHRRREIPFGTVFPLGLRYRGMEGFDLPRYPRKGPVVSD